MNEIKGFTFYKNYYELVKYLPDGERLQLLDAIFKYMFDGEEPEFEGLLYGIWINIKMPLDNSKSNIENGKKGGAPKGNTNASKTTQKQPKNKPKTTEHTTQKQANNISIFLFLISNFYILNNNIKLKDKIIEYLEYKEYDKKEKYKERGMKSLLKQISDKVEEYGDEAVINLIDECMGNNWSGIIWDKIKPTRKKEGKEQMPEWWNKQYEKKPEKLDELNEILKDF